MIGNLMLAVSTALFSGLLAVGQINSVQPHKVSTELSSSHVYPDEQVELIESYSQRFNYSYNEFQDDVVCFRCYENQITEDYEYPINGPIQNFRINSWTSENNWQYRSFNELNSDAIYILYQRVDSWNSDRSQYYNSCLRFLVPEGFDTSLGLEFSFGIGFNKVIYGNYDFYFNYHTTSFAYTDSDGSFLNWFAFNLFSQSPSVTQDSPGSYNEDRYVRVKFLEYYICYNDTLTQSQGLQFVFNLNVVKYQTLQASYSMGYNQGYLDGYSIGWKDGYSTGLGTANNATFNNLFASIADTPLRFLYGLFNFNLFGTSMLIIILSLLTGIIVIGLVKKFWKR